MRKYGPVGLPMMSMIAATTLFTGLVRADDISTARDLTAVIALHGQPCGQVVDVKQQGDNDYVASCQDGNRYRVFLNAEGRVVVQKQ